MGEGKKLKSGLYITLTFVALIWSIKIIEYGFSIDLSGYGILPRTLKGSIGIFTAPLIHGDIFHLLSNTFPLLILGIAVFYFYDKIASWVIVMIYTMTGFWVWIAARDAYHIGASGLVYGMLTFLLFSGFLRRDRATLSISFMILVLYGGSFFAGILPGEKHISWESHLMGAIAGIFCAVYFKNSGKPDDPSDESDEQNIQLTEYHYTYVASKKEGEPKKYHTKLPIESTSGNKGDNLFA
ncbi:rhomboid family intramembrane serine protease [Fulvivirga sp. M361]|uniref:rhomboid family intramembrane serine protease n=1 Tax=Fulvivirga sp. M361 TaxID=2594266 RepID=UPI00117B7D47|nr:rhomboid family intramembrane serine protease [Fulvivirga sp. M361]TRX48137.1 rhomboid family intramembrane serine protease [Fulvivirga sp. M361]